MFTSKIEDLIPWKTKAQLYYLRNLISMRQCYTDAIVLGTGAVKIHDSGRIDYVDWTEAQKLKEKK